MSARTHRRWHGYRGLANEFPDQVSSPAEKPKAMKVPNDGADTEPYGRREMQRRQSSRRICVEHANAEVPQGSPAVAPAPAVHRPGRRETYDETYGDAHFAIAALVSDRAAKRPTRHKASAELVHVRTTSC